jgi:hypothetical protein
MERPVGLAFCKILFAAKGGQFDAHGRPIFVEGVAALCDDPHDCGGCAHLQNWCSQLIAEGWQLSWECVSCLRETEVLDKAANTSRHIQGYFQQGGKHPWATPDEEEPHLAGCTRCGAASIVLQLIIRRNP